MLEEHPHVLQVVNKHHYLQVKFDTGITEYWALTEEGLKKQRSYKLPFDEDLFVDREIYSFRQFETNKLLYPEDYEILKDHFIIKNLDKVGWCDVRFKVHDLAVELVEEGYIPIRYTDEILNKDLEDLRNEDLSRYQQGITRFCAYSPLPPSGKRLIMHFMPCHAKDQWDFYSLYRTINNLLPRNLTREDIVYNLSKEHQNTTHPAFYRALFRQWFDIKGKSVYDLCPEWGFKALATAVEGGCYHCDSPYLKNLQEMVEYVGGEAYSPDQPHYDLIILSDARPVDVESAEALISNFRDISDYLMISVKADTVEEWKYLIDRYKPEHALRIGTNVVSGPRGDNIIMIIKS